MIFRVSLMASPLGVKMGSTASSVASVTAAWTTLTSLTTGGSVSGGGTPALRHSVVVKSRSPEMARRYPLEGSGSMWMRDPGVRTES